MNYQLAQKDDQTAIFEALCDMYNAHDASIGMELSLVCQKVNRADFRKRIEIAAQGTGSTGCAPLYGYARGSLNTATMAWSRQFLVLTIEAKNSKECQARFSRITLTRLNYFKAMGALAEALDGKEWLAVLHGVLHPDGERFSFAWEWLAPPACRSRTSSCRPPSASGGQAVPDGGKYGAVSFLQITAPELQ